MSSSSSSLAYQIEQTEKRLAELRTAHEQAQIQPFLMACEAGEMRWKVWIVKRTPTPTYVFASKQEADACARRFFDFVCVSEDYTIKEIVAALKANTLQMPTPGDGVGSPTGKQQ